MGKRLLIYPLEEIAEAEIVFEKNLWENGIKNKLINKKARKD
ncbi:hypothetical protein ACXEO8_15615 [Cytobacillus firmus]|nr:hypothetical protein [Bacillus sp. 22-7]